MAERVKFLTDVYKSEYIKKTLKSKEIWTSLNEVTPWGVHSNWRIFDPHPLIISRAKGSRIWDVDGNEYIDFNMAFGALVVGHANPHLIDKVRERMADGTIYGHETEWSLKLSKALTERFGYDMVRFSSTGLEATSLAVRLARAFTGRTKILKFEGHYHGTHDALAVGVKPDPAHAGHPKEPKAIPAGYPLTAIPTEIANTVIVAPWNDIEAVENIMRKHGNDIAAIILEPIAMNMGVVPATKEFIWSLRRLADEYNCLLIYDEVKTSGMWYRGAQEYYGVKADIITVAKALGGGFPFSAVLSSRKIMELIGPKRVPHGGTFNANPLSVYAAYVTVTELLTEANMQYTHNLSGELAKGYRDAIEDAKVDAHVVQVANKGTVFFSRDPIRNWRDFVSKVNWGLWYVWTLGMVVRGVIPQPMAIDEQWTISIMHSKEDIQKAIETAYTVLKEIKSGPVRPLAVEEAL